jgi:hypothetical protein
MIREQMWALFPLVAIVLLLAALALYVLCHTERQYRLKLALIPAVLAAGLGSAVLFGAKLGYAFPAPLPKSFEYLSHKVILEGDEKRWIDILVVRREPLDTGARLHREPWTQKLEDALKKASGMQAGGGEIHMDRDGDESGDLTPRRVLPEQVTPKTPVPMERQPPRNPNYSV